MTFIERITEDIKQAMRDKRSDDLSVLRMLSSALKYKKIELGNKEDISDETALSVVKTEVKKRKDSVTLYEQGGRPDLAEKEKNEIDFLCRYLPESLSEEEIEKIVAAIIAETADKGPAKFGQIMSLAMKKTQDQADGQAVSAIVKKLLAK